MPQFLLSVWHDDDYEVDFSSPEAQADVRRVSALNADMEAAGVWVFGVGLEPAATASVARAAGAAGAAVSMTDGPYAETKEQMAGFWVIDAPDLDAALEWAAKASVACERPIEVRPTHA